MRECREHRERWNASFAAHCTAYTMMCFLDHFLPIHFHVQFVRQALPTINRVLPTLGYGVASRIEREDASSISSSSSTSASPGPVGTKTVLSLRGRKGQLSVGEVHALVQEIDGMLARPGIFEFEGNL